MEKKYKEDSTRGKSLVHSPKRYKGDALVQAWLDSRVIATLSIWLEQNGMNPRFMSDVVRDSLKTVCDFAVKHGMVEMVEDTDDARGMLERRYRCNLNPQGRGLKNLMHNRLLSSMRLKSDDMPVEPLVSSQPDAMVPMENVVPDVASPAKKQRGKLTSEKIEEMIRRSDEAIKKRIVTGKHRITY